MSKKSLFIGAIASVIAINSVFADTTVTSRNYVDTQDALKQNKITAGTTGNVVTYNGTQNGQAQFSERGIFDPETSWENGEIVSGHEGDLLDAGSIFPELVGMGNMVQTMGNALQGTAGNVITYDENGFAGGERGIYDGLTTYDSSTDADKLVTASALQNATDNLPTITTSKMTCVDSPDCTLWSVADQTVYGVCKGYGEYVSVDGDASECCSGFFNGVNKCGCKNNSDCPDGIECVQSGTYRYCNIGGGGK